MAGALGTTALPFWPALIFTYIEPLLCLLGALSALLTPTQFTTSQLPTPSQTPTTPLPPAAILLSYTIGSLFLLIAGISMLCTVLTRDPHVTKYYLLLLMAGDVGHLVANYYGLGGGVFWDWRGWNATMWGNIAVTVGLFVCRLGTVVGGFGRTGWVGVVQGERGRKGM